MLSDKTTFSFNVYNSIKENFVAIEQLSPMVALPNLGADLGGAVNSYFTSCIHSSLWTSIWTLLCNIVIKRLYSCW